MRGRNVRFDTLVAPCTAIYTFASRLTMSLEKQFC